MTGSIQLIFTVLGISSAFLLFALGMFIDLLERTHITQGFAIGIGVASLCTFAPTLFFILWYYGFGTW